MRHKDNKGQSDEKNNKKKKNAHESETEADLVVGAQDVDEELVAAAVVDDVKTAAVVVVLELLMVQVASVSARKMKTMRGTKTMKNNLTQNQGKERA